MLSQPSLSICSVLDLHVGQQLAVGGPRVIFEASLVGRVGALRSHSSNNHGVADDRIFLVTLERIAPQVLLEEIVNDRGSSEKRVHVLESLVILGERALKHFNDVRFLRRLVISLRVGLDQLRGRDRRVGAARQTSGDMALVQIPRCRVR
mgnify:CR=1 FL=1